MTRKEKMQKTIAARNALSPEQHAKNMENFVFDLQLFGKDGGKRAGKILLTAGAFFLGAGHVGMAALGATSSFAGGIMAASLVGTIWNVASSRKGMEGNSSPSIQRFDKAQEGMSSTSQIPVVYGMRKICGNQTFHETNADQNTLHKHVVLCEGGIGGIVSVCANDLLIPTGKQTEGTVFTIQNVKYKDARVWKDGKTLHLYANGEDYTIYLCNKDDAERADTFYEWQANTSSLVSYINRMHKGWQAFPYATTSKYPGDLRVDGTECYMSTASVTADAVKGGTIFTFHDGEPPDNYEEVGGYPNMAWLDMYFQSTEELNGNPSVDCIVKGRKVYDPRTKKTAYSNNPALCVLDFLTNKRYGLGKWVSYDDVDIDSFTESANYCDQEVTVYDADDNPLKSKRYTLDMIIDERQDAAQWLQDMLANFSAWLVISKDKIKLMVEQPSPIVHKFTDDNITSMTITPIKASETPNHYEVSLCDPMYNNWRVIQVVHDDYADQKQRGKVISKTVELSGVTSQSQALRLAQFYSDYNLSCPIVVSFTTGIEAMALEPGDVISVSYRDTFVDMPVRISEIKETAENEFEITARQYNADIYGDDLSGGIQIKTYVTSNDNSDEDSPYFALTNVKNLQAVSQHRRKEDGTVAYDIIVSFDLPQNYNIKSAKVYYKNNHVPARETVYFLEGVKADDLGYLSDWKCAGETSRALKIPNVAEGDVYKIRVAVRSKKGREQELANCPEVICKVTKRATVPPQPHNLTYDFSNDFLFSWNDVEDSDVMYYELRTDTNVGQSMGLLGRSQVSSAVVKLTSRQGRVYVYAIDTQKKASYPVYIDYIYPKPDAPVGLEFYMQPRGVRIVSPAFPSGCQSMNLYITSTKVSDKIVSKNPVYTYDGKPDVYSLKAAYVDRLGEGYASREFAFVIEPTFSEEWIKDGSISIAKMDKEIAEAVSDAQKIVPWVKGIDTSIEKIDTSILGINNDITELKKSDGEIKSTIVRTNNETAEKFASQIKQTAENISLTVAANKKAQDDKNEELASQIKQSADSIAATVQENINSQNSNIAKIDLKADSITSTVQNIQKALNSEDPAKTGFVAISQIKQTADSISSTVQETKNELEGKISQVEQTADSISSTVQSVKNDTNEAISDLSSKITQTAGKITSVVAELGKDPSESSYSTITQLVDGINARVAKGDVINQINMTAKGTTIDGQYVHITGTTKIDDNVIVGGMIKAGSITADKLSAKTIALTGEQGIKGGAATLDASGMTVATKNGSVSFDSEGMSFKDNNGQAFSVIGRFLTGVANEGQYVKFTKPWDVVPTVMVIPTTMQTGVANYSSSNTYTKCYAENISKDGFKVRCYSCLGAGSNGVVGINKRCVISKNVDFSKLTQNGWTDLGCDEKHSDMYYICLYKRRSPAQLVDLGIPNTATSATIRTTAKGYFNQVMNVHRTESGSGSVWKTWHWFCERHLVRIEYLVNGSVVAMDTCSEKEETPIIRNITFAKGATVSIRVSLDLELGNDSNQPISLDYVDSNGELGHALIETATVNTNSESVIATGAAAFIVTDTANKQYTIS